MTAPRPRPHDVSVVLLAEPRVVVEGDEVELRGLMPRAIIARLALAAGAAVPADQLIAELWQEPSPVAVVSLRSYLSRLRDGPLGPFLLGGRGGYRLDVVADDVDLLRFRRLARADAPKADLDEAHALWTGGVLVGLERVPFAQEVVAETRGVHRSLAERQAEHRLDADDIRGALELLEPLAATYSDHERPSELLATALGRAGRGADALAVIDGFQRRRAETLGLDPAAALARLRQAIVRLDLESGAGTGSAASVVRHAVPLPLTVFVGRERELAAIRLARQSSRLVTLVGPGGVGKTRLAVEAARRVGDHEDAEQWFLELAPLTSAGAVVAALSALVGASSPSVDTIARAIDGRRGLLVLDNAEHLVGDIAELCKGLLAATAGISVLVTSRQALGIPGERRIEVEPFLGDDTDAAVRIFCDRADDVVPGLDLAATDRALIEGIVIALDGLPLALELAAARLVSLSLAELSAAIADRRLLSADADGDRQSSLPATIRWSTDLLGPDERLLLRQLAEFAGVFTADAARTICRLHPDGAAVGADAHRVGEALDGLVRASLVAVIRDERGAVSHRLLESVKYAARRLESDVDADWTVRHARWHADLVAAREPALHDDRESEVSASYDAIHPDLVLALEGSLSRSDRSCALRLVAGLGWYWFRRGMLGQGREWTERALALPAEEVAPDDARVEAEALVHLAMLLFQLGERDETFAATTRGLELAERVGDPGTRLRLLAFRSYWHAIYGDVEEALRLSDEAESIDGDPWSRSLALVIRGQALRSADQPARALDALTSASALADDGGDRWVAVVALAVRSKVLMDLKRGREALGLLLPITRLSTSQHDPSTTLTNLYLVAGASALVEQHAAGARLIGAAEALGRRIGWDATVSEPVDFVVYRERVRQGLPPALWNALLEDGARLSLGDAVGFALRLAPFADA